MGIHAIPLVIGGHEISDASGGEGRSHDPATGQLIATFALAGEREVESAVQSARDAFDTGPWTRMRPFERGRILRRIGELMLERRDHIARLEVADSGKPLRDAYWEVDCSARFFEYYSGVADKLHGSSIPLGPGLADWTVREAIGVSLHIIPWNYPFQLIARGVAPALVAGCSVIIKPAEQTPVTAYEFVKICLEAGLPMGQVNLVNGHGSQVGDMLARHKGVDQITFTGSVETGFKVLGAAASHAIPTAMELGGKSPQILFDDADIETALATIAGGVFTHCGQVCNAGTRLLVQRSIHDDVAKALHEKARSMTLGAGITDPDMGPLISRVQQDRVASYMQIAEQEGEVLMGANMPDDPALAGGHFARPAIVVGASRTSRIVREEVFGPVLAVMPFDTVDEAVDLANDSPFGLVAGVHTKDIGKAMSLAERIRAGQIWINGFGIGLDVEFPFGGYKLSGFGREKGLESIASYQQVKNVCVRY